MFVQPLNEQEYSILPVYVANQFSLECINQHLNTINTFLLSNSEGKYTVMRFSWIVTGMSLHCNLKISIPQLEGIFFSSRPPLGKTYFSSIETPAPGISNPLCIGGGVWIHSGTRCYMFTYYLR